ncbi:MAG: polysulfide reductase NrfD [Alphaproteobacteria bacterium]|nr:polysulfide reductase NrfD [Alphaproteobacteria bacterium]
MANLPDLVYQEINSKRPCFRAAVVILGLIFLIGLGAAYYMEHSGHWVTGMSNEVVWGMPHVFAVFLIVAASGALNVASIGSVFGKSVYKPLAPLSALLALALLAGGLAVLVLDLGRPDRLIVAMSHFNFKSIFAANIILYTGFFGIVLVYLWFMMDRRLKSKSSGPGTFAFIWRLVLTTGTGSIFGFLMAREAYSSAVMAPLFIAMSLSFGTALFILVMLAAYTMDRRPLGVVITERLRVLLAVFVAATAYLALLQHVTAAYWAGRGEVVDFLLFGSGFYSFHFWGVQMGIGTIFPLMLTLVPRMRSHGTLAFASFLVVIGGLAQVFIIIIGGQAWPLTLFPGYEVESSFFDGVVHGYSPSLPEILLGLGGFALALLIVALGTAILRFLPVSLADADIDPHARKHQAETKDEEEAEPAPAA